VGKDEEAGLGIEQLTEAFAGMLGGGSDPYAPAGGDDLPAAQVPFETADAAGGPCEICPRSIVEAVLFVGNPTTPITSRNLAALMRGVRPAEIDDLIRELNADYARRKCPYTIVEEAGGYRMTLTDEFDRLRDKFYGRTRQARLSQAAIEVLAAVAYHQPVTAEQIAQLRGTASGHVLAQLVRRQLVRLERSADNPRRPVYWTTDRFLELFGLKSLADLPRSHEFEPP
jgi:segregation and condensation protein B